MPALRQKVHFVEPTMAAEIAEWRVAVDAVYKELVGKTAVKLVGDRPVCRQFECNLGMATTTHMGFDQFL